MEPKTIEMTLNDVACMVTAAARLMAGLTEAFGYSADHYIDRNGTGESAREWMIEHYETVAGAVRSTAELLDVASKYLIDNT